jgi:beta-glucosidase
VERHLADLRAGGDVGDWVGVQYYSRIRVDATQGGLSTASEGAETTQMGWEVHPSGFGLVLRRAAETGLPVIVTENGIATADDRQRERYLCSHLAELKRARDAGVDVRGYLHWSAFDNFEWTRGYHPTFGLIGIDRADNLRRVVKPSAVKFGNLARSGDLSALA